MHFQDRLEKHFEIISCYVSLVGTEKRKGAFGDIPAAVFLPKTHELSLCQFFLLGFSILLQEQWSKVTGKPHNILQQLSGFSLPDFFIPKNSPNLFLNFCLLDLLKRLSFRIVETWYFFCVVFNIMLDGLSQQC